MGLQCLPERRQLFVEVDGHVHRAGERDDFDVELVIRCQTQQARQRRTALLRLEVHEAAAHRESPDHRQLLRFGPAKKLFGLLFILVGDVVDEPERGQAAPLERLALGRSEACTVDLKVSGGSGRSLRSSRHVSLFGPSARERVQRHAEDQRQRKRDLHFSALNPCNSAPLAGFPS